MAFGQYSLQMNYRDPRFMQALQEAKAATPYAALPNRANKAATAAFVNNQMGFLSAMDRIGLQSKIHEDNLGLKRAQLAWDQEKHKKDIRMQKDALKGQLIGGGLTSIFAAYQGHQQRKAMLKQAQDQEAFLSDIRDTYREILKRQQGIL